MQEFLSFAFEAWGSIEHDAFSLRGADLAAEVGLAGFAELTLSAFWYAKKKQRSHVNVALDYMKCRVWKGNGILKSDNVVAWLDIRHPFSYGLYYTCTLVSKDDRKRALGVFA